MLDTRLSLKILKREFNEIVSKSYKIKNQVVTNDSVQEVGDLKEMVILNFGVLNNKVDGPTHSLKFLGTSSDSKTLDMVEDIVNVHVKGNLVDIDLINSNNSNLILVEDFSSSSRLGIEDVDNVNFNLRIVLIGMG